MYSPEQGPAIFIIITVHSNHEVLYSTLFSWRQKVFFRNQTRRIKQSAYGCWYKEIHLAVSTEVSRSLSFACSSLGPLLFPFLNRRLNIHK